VRFVVEGGRGARDFDLLSIAFEEDRLVISEDFDFGELTVRAKVPAHGVVLIAMGNDPMELRVERVAELVSRHGEELAGHLTIVDRRRIRCRPLGLP
jgi:predicted nuclease of predicted toxin-antitoxin system